MPLYNIDLNTRILTGPVEPIPIPGVGILPPGNAIDLPDVLPVTAGHAWVLGDDAKPEQVEDHRGIAYEKATALQVSHSALGPLPDHLTPLVPPERYPLWQSGAWGTDLQTACAEAAKRIDAAVDGATYRVVGSRLAEYQQAETEAAAYHDAGYSGAVPVSVAAHVEAYGVSAQEAADTILAMAAAWRGAQMQMRVARLVGKQQCLSAADIPQLDALVAQATADINAAVAPLLG